MDNTKLRHGIGWRIAARVLRFMRRPLSVLIVVVLAFLAYGAWTGPVYPDSIHRPMNAFTRGLYERYWAATEEQRGSPQWTRELLFEVAREVRLVQRGWVHRVRVSIDDEDRKGLDGRTWPGTVARANESYFPRPPHGGDWFVLHETHWLFEPEGPRRVFGLGEYGFSVHVAPESWMARLSHFVWPFVLWNPVGT